MRRFSASIRVKFFVERFYVGMCGIVARGQHRLLSHSTLGIILLFYVTVFGYDDYVLVRPPWLKHGWAGWAASILTISLDLNCFSRTIGALAAD